MSDNSFPYLELILFGMFAGFVLLRLRSILGQNTGFEGRPAAPNPAALTKEDIIVQLSQKLKVQKRDAVEDPLAVGLTAEQKQTIDAIHKQDAQFSLSSFIAGARTAFEMVFDAYLKNDKATLESLLAPELAKVFTAAAESRTQGERITETTLVSVEAITTKHIEFQAPIARITLSIISEQVTVVRDKSGAIIEGNASQIERVEDEWTFERNVTSKNPAWTIIDT